MCILCAWALVWWFAVQFASFLLMWGLHRFCWCACCTVLHDVFVRAFAMRSAHDIVVEHMFRCLLASVCRSHMAQSNP